MSKLFFLILANLLTFNLMAGELGHQLPTERVQFFVQDIQLTCHPDHLSLEIVNPAKLAQVNSVAGLEHKTFKMCGIDSVEHCLQVKNVFLNYFGTAGGVVVKAKAYGFMAGGDQVKENLYLFLKYPAGGSSFMSTEFGVRR